MILQALLAYAERENLGDADFETVGVRWQIPLTRDGRLAGPPIPLSDEPTAKKPPPKRLIRPKSDPDFVSHGRSYFLCDSLERSTVFLDDDAKIAKRRVNQAYFIGLLDEAANDCVDHRDALLVVTSFLRDEVRTRELHGRLAQAKAKPSDNAVFAVDGVSLLNLPGLRGWWRKKNQVLRNQQEAVSAVCLATGRLGAVCRTTGFIKLLGEDTKLISFNKECPAFESYDLSQAANAPIAIDAEEGIRTSINTLVQHARDQRLVFNDTIYLHWTREPMEFDPLALLTTGDPEGVAHLLQSVRAGNRQLGLDANAYYCLGLSGNGARIVVRDWLETTAARIEVAIASWFEGIELIEPDGSKIRNGFTLGQMLWGLANPKLKNPYEILPSAAGESLLRAAITDSSISQSLLAAALRRERVDRVSRDEENHRPLPFLPARHALIRIILNRTPNHPTMTATLNTTCSDRPYLCGRLLAVFERLQYLAQGRRNSGVVDRFYAAASTTPALVMPRLFRNAEVAHLPNAGNGLDIELADDQKRAIAENVRKDFEEITSALGCSFPPTLTLEEQGRFALGFYHQKADYRRRTAERKEQAAAESAAAL